MANIFVNKCINKTNHGWVVTNRKGEILGSFKDKDYAMHRLFQVEDRAKGREELKEIEHYRKNR